MITLFSRLFCFILFIIYCGSDILLEGGTVTSIKFEIWLCLCKPDLDVLGSQAMLNLIGTIATDKI